MAIRGIRIITKQEHLIVLYLQYRNTEERKINKSDLLLSMFYKCLTDQANNFFIFSSQLCVQKSYLTLFDMGFL